MPCASLEVAVVVVMVMVGSGVNKFLSQVMSSRRQSNRMGFKTLN